MTSDHAIGRDSNMRRERRPVSKYVTWFGSLEQYEKGEIIDDDAKHFASVANRRRTCRTADEPDRAAARRVLHTHHGPPGST
ncbi:MAG: hypothetical protein GEU79_13570 [Acidimicrobiia bacterium]|nr:hypothetical protein [Acidimicrobiia bacterium]